jgi:hypothetical protein
VHHPEILHFKAELYVPDGMGQGQMYPDVTDQRGFHANVGSHKALATLRPRGNCLAPYIQLFTGCLTKDLRMAPGLH